MHIGDGDWRVCSQTTPGARRNALRLREFLVVEIEVSISGMLHNLRRSAGTFPICW
jgi:hypothetical protein